MINSTDTQSIDLRGTIERKEKTATSVANTSELKNEKLSIVRSELELDLIGSFDNIQNTPNTQKIKSYSRFITRQNIGQRYESTVNKLVSRRNIIIDKKYSEGLNGAEIKELRYIDWQLDTIEDAFEGDALDEVEYWVNKQEEIGKKIEQLYDFLEKNISKKR